MKKIKPKKWTEVYKQGTQEGNEEQKLFIALSRNKKFEWRSVGMLAKESGLTKVRVEEILDKYYKKGMVFQSSTNDELWAYWERVPDLLPDDIGTVATADQKKRLAQP